MDAEKIAAASWTAPGTDTNRDRPVSKGRWWTGAVLSGLGVLFLSFDVTIKLAKTGQVVDSMRELGYSPDLARPLGATLLACVALYLVPRTAPLGALLLTGYLGGAVATHVRMGNPLLSHTLFPIYFAVILWAGLVLRDDRLRVLLPRA